LTELRNTLFEQFIERLLGINADREVRNVAAVDHNQSRDELGKFHSQCSRDKCAHRVTHDYTWAEPKRPHRRGYIAGMLCHTVWAARLLGVTAATQVNREE
jgi:hypothetical protein